MGSWEVTVGDHRPAREHGGKENTTRLRMSDTGEYWQDAAFVVSDPAQCLTIPLRLILSLEIKQLPALWVESAEQYLESASQEDWA